MAVHMVGVNFAISSSLAAMTGAMQTRDHEYKTEVESIRDGSGTTVSRVYYDASEEATFEYVATGTNGVVNATVTVPTNGALMTVTDASYSAIAGSTWIVENVATKVSNTSAVRVTVKLSRWPGISS